MRLSRPSLSVVRRPRLLPRTRTGRRRLVRAVALCQEPGVHSYGLSAVDHHDAVWCYGATRELFAAGKASQDAAFEPDPQFLGPGGGGCGAGAGPRPVMT